MTAIVAFNFGKTLVFLSDLRVTYHKRQGYVHSDDTVKVTRLADNALIGCAGSLSGAKKTLEYIAKRRDELTRRKNAAITLRHLQGWLAHLFQSELRTDERRLEFLIVSSHIKHDDNTKARFGITACKPEPGRGHVQVLDWSDRPYSVVGSAVQVDKLQPFLSKAHEIYSRERKLSTLTLDLSMKFSMIALLEAGIGHFFQVWVLTAHGCRHISYPMPNVSGRANYSSSFALPNPWHDEPAPTLADVVVTQIAASAQQFFTCEERDGKYTLRNLGSGRERPLRTLVKDDPQKPLGIRYVMPWQ